MSRGPVSSQQVTGPREDRFATMATAGAGNKGAEIVIHFKINDADLDDANFLNLKEFGEDLGLPYACLPIAGLQFYDYDTVDDLIGRIRPVRGDRLQLVRQPDNPYDGNAIETRWRNGRLLLGHLPRDPAGQIAPLLDAGKAIRCYAMNSGDGSVWSVWALLVSECLVETMMGSESLKIQSSLESRI